MNKVDISGAPAMDQLCLAANFTTEWTAASSLDAKLELWAEEFWITQRGNGIDAYNSYRRNGYPKIFNQWLNQIRAIPCFNVLSTKLCG